MDCKDVDGLTCVSAFKLLFIFFVGHGHIFRVVVIWIIPSNERESKIQEVYLEYSHFVGNKDA